MAIYVKDEGNRERSGNEQKRLVRYLMGMNDDAQPMGRNVDYGRERNAPSDVTACPGKDGIFPAPGDGS